MSEGNLISPGDAARRFMLGQISYDDLRLIEAQHPRAWSTVAEVVAERDEAIRQRDERRAERETLAQRLVEALKWVELRRQQAARAQRSLREVRAILAPLLDAPVEEVLIDGVWRVRCRFCWAVGGDPIHGPECTAHPANRDRLLGRGET